MKLKNRQTFKPKLKDYIGKKPVKLETDTVKLETKNELPSTKRK